MDTLYASVQAKLDRSANHNDFGWLAVVLPILAILFLYSQVAIGYTHGSVVGTLAMVEDTNPTAVIRSTVDAKSGEDGLPPYMDEPDAPPPSYSHEEVLLLSPTPITASNRGTVRHLKQVGGRGARFRGLGIAILYALATHWLAGGIHAIFGVHGMIGAAISFIAAQGILFRVNMLWTHVVISAPSNKRMIHRFVPWSRAKKALGPTLGWSVAHMAIPAMLIGEIKLLGIESLVQKLDNKGKLMDIEVVMLAGSTLLVLMSAAVLMLVVYVPANVALTRIQAALLDESETAIVPFDRAFGNMLDPEAKKLRLKDAWRSFDWNGRIRLAKVYVKTVCFQMMSAFAFGLIVLAMTAVWAIVF